MNFLLILHRFNSDFSKFTTVINPNITVVEQKILQCLTLKDRKNASFFVLSQDLKL